MKYRPKGPPLVPTHPRQSAPDPVEERQLQLEYERLERESPNVPLLLDYLHGELPPAGMRMVVEQLAHDEALRREAESLADMIGAVREHEGRLRREAAPRMERMTASLMRRLAEQHARGDSTRQPVALRRRRRLVTIALLVASPLLLWLAMLVTPGVRDWWPLQPRWEVQRVATAQAFDLYVDDRTQLVGRGPLFLAIRRPGLGWPDRAAAQVTELVVDAPELTINFHAPSNERLQLSSPLGQFSTTDVLVELRTRPGGGHLIQVRRGQVLVTLARAGGAPIPIAAGAELALTATGAIDDEPPAAGSPFTRVMPEVP